METIFITSFHPLIPRNILSTPILEGLTRRRGMRVVLLVPGKRVPVEGGRPRLAPSKFFSAEFGSSGALIEPVARHLDWQDGFFRYLSLSALGTRALDIKRETELDRSGAWLSRLIANRSWARRAIRRLDRMILPRGRFRTFFPRYRPDLVFATDVQNELDVRLMHEARDRAIPIAGMVRSWDNLTAKGLIRIVPDVLVVHNDLVRAEAIRYHGISPERIAVVGIPHYDAYIGEPRASREEFCRRIGADPARRIILFAPTGDRYLSQNRVDREVLELLTAAAPPGCQILVRFPPQDTASFEGFDSDGRVFFDRPTSAYTKNPRKIVLTRDMDRHLADTIFHSSLVVAGPSTMSIDAALFDKPVILVGFDGHHPRPYHQGVRRYFDYEHQQPILQSGGARLAESPEEFGELIRRYLADPSLDRQGRARIVHEQCGAMDGRATERLCNAIAGLLA